MRDGASIPHLSHRIFPKRYVGLLFPRELGPAKLSVNGSPGGFTRRNYRGDGDRRSVEVGVFQKHIWLALAVGPCVLGSAWPATHMSPKAWTGKRQKPFRVDQVGNAFPGSFSFAASAQ